MFEKLIEKEKFLFYIYTDIKLKKNLVRLVVLTSRDVTTAIFVVYNRLSRSMRESY